MISKAYPKYKPSGVEWLGDVPEHWGIKKLKFIGKSLIGLTYSPDNVVDEDYEGEKHLVLRSTNIQDGKISLHENVFVTTRVPKELKVRKWDILICARNGSRHLVGKNALINDTNDNMTFGAFTTVFRSKINSFLFYYFSSNQFQYQSTGFLTTTINQLTNGNLNSIITTLPPLLEQQSIVAFLDRETGRIDSLIEKKQRLLELLAEQRTALISRVVTKGLDASVKLKPSGVEWLGDVPEHWVVLPLKRIVAVPVTDGPHETPEILDEGIPFVSAEAIRSSKIDFNRIRGYISESEHHRFCLKYKPKRDDIYMIKSGATTGNLAIVETDDEFNIWSPLAVIRVHKKKADARFVLSAMNSKEFQTSVQLFWSFGTQQNIGMNVIENLIIPLPPISEQKTIAAFIDSETAKIDTLSAKVASVIERLKEYRTALISSAVTGKIDVREIV